MIGHVILNVTSNKCATINKRAFPSWGTYVAVFLSVVRLIIENNASLRQKREQ